MAHKRIIITRQSRPVTRSFVGSSPLPQKPPLQDPPTPTPTISGVGGGLHAAGGAALRGGMHAQARASAHMRESNHGNKVVEELLAKAQALTATQRLELLDQLSLANKLTRKAGQDRDLDMWAEGVYNALETRIGTSEGSAYGRLLVKQLLAPSSNWRPMQDFMQESRLCELKVPERASVYFMLAELLVKHAARIAAHTGAPLGPKLVGSCAQAIAGVFDQAFPGYLRAGLAKIAARQLVRGSV